MKKYLGSGVVAEYNKTELILTDLQDQQIIILSKHAINELTKVLYEITQLPNRSKK